MAIPGQHSWAVSEIVTAANMKTYLGPPPPIVDIDVFGNPIANTNWNTPQANPSGTGAELYNGVMASTGAQNAEINWYVGLGAGTWTFEVMHRVNTDRGIYTVQISTDGASFTSVGSAPYNGSAPTIDGYAAAAASNTRSTITGITVGTTGVYELKLLMATKNASSGGYTGAIQHVQWRRTA